ncbi:MAG: hypothetical protein IJA52_00200 [Clostridia bacterium]|nr:hypothetical protein [Clostridia bacterium]
MNFRTEEEKTNDMIIYEKKAQAGAIVAEYKKVAKKANISALISAVVLCSIAFPVFFIPAYDSEIIIGMIATVLTVLLLVLFVRFLTGSILTRSLPSFMKWGSLSARWTEARRDMHDLQEKFAEQKAFADDIDTAEKKLLDLSERLIAFAKDNEINAE